MSIIKKIVTFKPSFTLRVIIGALSVVGFLSACLIVGIGDMTNVLGQNDAQYTGRAIEQGAVVYFQYCARCHGTDGKGIEGQGPALNSLYFLGKVENGRIVTPSQRLVDIGWVGNLGSYIQAVTASGIPLKSSNVWDVTQPPFSQTYGGNLRDDQIQNVTTFILNWQQDPATTGTIESPKPGEAFAPKPTAVPLSPEEEAGKAIFLKSGCTACHTIAGVSTGAIGPILSHIGTDASSIIASPEYKSSQGKATTVTEYLQESIESPNTFITPKCPQGPCQANIMPQNFKDTIPATDLANLIAYLSSLK